MARNPLTPYRGGGLLGGFDPFTSLQREMNRLFDEVMGGLPAAAGAQGGAGAILNAQMDVSETDREIRVCAELPGVSEQDIEVSLQDDVLTIRGEKKFERKDEKESFHFVERSYGTFQRSIRLPVSVDADQVQASFENGVLTVTLPKTAQQERTRRIEVRRGASPAALTEQQGGASGKSREGRAKGGESGSGG